MSALFHFHSGLRYLVLIACALVICYSAFGLATKRPWDRRAFILNSAFIGLYDLQVLVGFLLVFTGVFYPSLAGHIVMMLIGAGVIHVLSSKNKKKDSPGYAFPLAGALGALFCIVGGIMAIQRSII